MEHGIILDGSVITSVIAERSLRAQLARLDIPFQDKVNVRWYLKVDRLAANEVDGFSSQKTGEEKLVQPVRQWCSCSEGIYGIATQCDCDRHAFPALVISFAVSRANLVKLPVHCGRMSIVDLHPVDADVAGPRLRIARVHICQRDETSAVFGPAFEYRQIFQ